MLRFPGELAEPADFFLRKQMVNNLDGFKIIQALRA